MDQRGARLSDRITMLARFLHRPRRLLTALAVVASLCAARQALADEAPPVLLAPAVPLNDSAEAAPAPPAAQPERTWLFLEEPQLPAPLHVVAFSRGTYTSSGVSPTRPFSSNIATPGGVVELGGELGILPWLSVQATGVIGDLAPTSKPAGGAVAGLRFSVIPRSIENTRLVLSSGYLRELGGGNGAWARAAFTQDIGRFRLAALVHGEHVFLGGRDPVDLMVMAGASAHVAGPLRVGVEYVGQDLEELGDKAAEGGARQFLGPVMSLEFFRRHLSIVGGPAVGLSYGSPKILGRAALAYGF